MAFQRVLGSILKIPFGDGQYAFGQVLGDPEIAIFDFSDQGDPSLEEIVSAPLLWRLWVMRSAVSSGRWVKIGKAAIRPEFSVQVPRFKRDPISKDFSLYINGQETPVRAEDCLPYECAAVWSAEHVEDRLRDHSQGVENKWLKSLRACLPS
jgi:hypothetical protein